MTAAKRRTTVGAALAALFLATFALPAVASIPPPVSRLGPLDVAGVGRPAEPSIAELEATYESAKDTISVIAEDPVGVGVAIANGVVDTAKGVASGDAGAITEATSFIASTLSGAKAASAGAQVAGVVSRVARSADEVAEAAVDAAKAVGRANRARQAAQRAERAVPDELAPVTRGEVAKPKYCFVAGTLVATALGLQSIEEVAIGDLVWSRNEESGETRLQEVVQLFVTPDQPIYELELASADGSVETLGVTAEHPFWVESRGWVGAAALQPGDRLATNLDGWLAVLQVRGSPRRETVYNFEVAVDHTYFVGRGEAWVHNLCEEGKQRVRDNLRASAEARSNSRFKEYAAKDLEIQRAGSTADVELNRFLQGEGAKDARRHAIEAADAGCCVTGVVDRLGAAQRRRGRLKGMETRKGFDRDEFPPAVIKPDDPSNISVDYVVSSDNRSSGSTLGHELEGIADGTRVRIVVPRKEDLP